MVYELHLNLKILNLLISFSNLPLLVPVSKVKDNLKGVLMLEVGIIESEGDPAAVNRVIV